MTDELQTARDLAVRAGAILLEHYAATTTVEWKSRGNPVTEADKAASRFVVAELRKLYPDDGILCEEEKDDDTRLDKSRVWIIDPMDGTKEFIDRVGEFSVMIGLAVDGVATVGAVYQPTEGKLYTAATGSGAYLEHGGQRTLLRVSPESDPRQMIIAVSRSHHSSDAEMVRETLGIEKTIRSGSGGLKVGLICEARAHVYLHIGTHMHQWDTCAPEAILNEAGGRMTDVFDVPLQYNARETRNMQGVIATNGTVHGRVAEAARLALLRSRQS